MPSQRLEDQVLQQCPLNNSKSKIGVPSTHPSAKWINVISLLPAAQEQTKSFIGIPMTHQVCLFDGLKIPALMSANVAALMPAQRVPPSACSICTKISICDRGNKLVSSRFKSLSDDDEKSLLIFYLLSIFSFFLLCWKWPELKYNQKLTIMSRNVGLDIHNLLLLDHVKLYFLHSLPYECINFVEFET